jgi:hypothetical protein
MTLWGTALLNLAIACAIAVLPGPAVAQRCAGDCNSDLAIRIDELVAGVRIGLGAAPLSQCASLDTDHDSAVAIDELLTAVGFSLNGCPNTLRIHGICQRPGATGLEPCPANTIVELFRCGLRRTCLSESNGPFLIGSTRVGTGGSFLLALDRAGIGANVLVLEAQVADGADGGYRALSFDLRDDPEQTLIDVLIDPVSEAGAAILAEHRFEQFDDPGAEEVLSAIRSATANVDFRGLDPHEAVLLAMSTADADAAVQQAIANRVTPTITPTATPTATPTSPPTPRGRCDPGPTPVLPAVGEPTIRFGSASGAPGSSVCIGATLQTAGLNVGGIDFTVDRISEAPIAVNDDGTAACAPARVVSGLSGLPFFPGDCTPGLDCTGARLFGIRLSGFPDGLLALTCELDIDPNTPPGAYPVGCSNAAASDSTGHSLPLGCVAGTVSVVAAGAG